MSLTVHTIIGFAALKNGRSAADGQDFFIMYTATRHAAQGLNPYANEYLHDALSARSRASGNNDVLAGGFYYPPQSMLLFRPFIALPFPAAFFCWYLFNTVLILACGSLAWIDCRNIERCKFGPCKPVQYTLAAALIIACMLVNPLTQRMLSLGQTSMIVPGAFVIGHWLINKNWRWLGAAIYSFSAIKPHLALPLLAIMPLLYGWRETIRCASFVVLFNLLGCVLTTGTLHTLMDFLHSASTAPLSIGFNQVTYDQIISWNRILFVVTGIAINLSVSQIVCGYLLVAALLWVRVNLIQRRRPSVSLLIAIAAMASLLCSQAKGYDFLIVVLLAPYMLQLWQAGDWSIVGTLFVLFLMAIVPRAVGVSVAGHLHLTRAGTEVVLSYRAFVVALMFMSILFRGELRRLEATSVLLN